MKRNLFSLASAAAFVLAVVFAGCTREEVKDDGTPRTLTVKISTAELATRAEGSGVANGTSSVIVDGWVVITNSSNVILKSVKMTTTTAGADEVTVAALTGGSGATINNVPASAQKVYVFANVEKAVTWPTNDGATPTPANTVTDGANISTYLAAVVNAKGLITSAGDITQVPLLGNGAAVPTSATQYDAAIEISPVAGRIEIGAITTSDSRIASFKVANIFVNNYYATSPIGGAVASAILVNNGSDGDDYVYASTGDAYFGLVNSLYDVVATTSTSKVVKPTSGYWAYNLPAPTIASPSKYFPHIIIKITDVTVTDQGADGGYENKTWYLTVGDVVLESVTNPTASDYLVFTKGNVYTFDTTTGINFTLDDLHEDPEPAAIKLVAKVTIKAWVQQEVKPILK